jgi:hypothetical protein
MKKKSGKCITKYVKLRSFFTIFHINSGKYSLPESIRHTLMLVINMSEIAHL